MENIKTAHGYQYIKDRSDHSKKYDLRGIAYILIALMLCLVFLNSRINYTPLSLLIILIAAIIGIFAPEILFPIFFVVSLSGDYFGAFQGVGLPRVLGIILLLGAIRKAVISGRLELRYWTYCIAIALFTFLSYLQAYVNSTTNLMTIFLDLSVFVALINFKLTKDQMERLFQNIYFVTIITVLFFAALLIFDPYPYIRGGIQRMTVAADLNPNTFSQMMAQLGAGCFGFAYLSKQKWIGKIFSYALGFVCMYCVLMSGSRAGLLALILGLLSTILIDILTRGGNLKSFLKYTLVIFIGVILFYFFLASHPHLASRMNLSSILQSGGSDRWTYIRVEWLYIIPKHLFFGVGIGTSNEVEAMLPYFSYTPLSSTNILFSMLTQIGLMGSLSFILFLRRIICDTVTRMKSNHLLFIPLIFMLTALWNGLGEVVFYERYLWNALALAALCMMTFESGGTTVKRVR